MNNDSIVPCNKIGNPCRIQVQNSFSTLAYYPPVYDKFGNNVNTDKNSTSMILHCTACNRKWKKMMAESGPILEEISTTDPQLLID